jgi:hypothetical protein
MVDGTLYDFPFPDALVRTFLINDSTCDFDRADFTLKDDSSTEVTSDTSPFWYDGETLYFQSSSEDDMGTYYWPSIGITFYVASDPSGVAAYLEAVAISEEQAAKEAELTESLAREEQDMDVPASAFFGEAKNEDPPQA